MSILEKVISFISPERAARREAWRQELEFMRSDYDAGDHSRLNSNWRVTNKSAEFTDRYDRDNVRARARDLERNSDMMNAVVGAFKRNVIGGGYTLQIKTDKEDINISLQKAWLKWCKKQNCDVTGTQSFMQMLRMAVERKKVDGGLIFVKRYTKQGFIPFQLQLFEVDELDTSQMAPKSKGNKVVGGIEYNSYNRPVGYWIRQYDTQGFTPHDPIYIKAEDVIFYFTKKRPSQLREISDMSPTISRIRDANEFINSVSVKERVLACLSVFIKRALPQSGVGRNGPKDARGKVNYDGKTLTPGMIKELNAGDEVQVVNPTGHAVDASSYTKQQLRLIGAGQGISYEAVSRDMSETNYSSARQGLIEDDLTYEDEKELLLEVLNEVYETFVISCWLAGIISAPDFWDRKEEYMKHEWIQTPKKWIDPAKEANANKIALNTGQKTFQQIAAEGGHDWKQQVKDMAEVIKFGEENDIELGGIIYGRPVSKVTEDTGEADAKKPSTNSNQSS